MTDELIRKSCNYSRKDARPFKMVIDKWKGEFGVLKHFLDGGQPERECLFAHKKLSKCDIAFDLREKGFNALYSKEEPLLSDQGKGDETANGEQAPEGTH